jgi:hypothetical protein
MFMKPRAGYYQPNPLITKTVNYVLELNQDYIESGKSAVNIGRGSFVETFLPIYRCVNNWRHHGFRHVWPSLDAGLICENTRVLENLSAAEFKGIFPAYCINVPKGLGLKLDPLGYMTHIVFDTSGRTMIPKGIPLEFLTNHVLETMGWYNIMMIFETGSPKLLQFPSNTKELTDAIGNIYLTGSTRGLFKDLLPHIGWAINLAILMHSYPSYVKRVSSRIKIKGEVRKTEELQVHLGREIQVERKVLDQIKRHNEHSVTGRRMPTHWRVGYWRRQPHGTEWKGEGRVGRFDDGREYHLKLIGPVLVNKPEVQTCGS